MSRDDFLTFLTPSGARTASLPVDFAILLTDTLESPSTFLLTHFLARALREPRKVVLVGLSQGWDHYATILRKSVSSSSCAAKGLEFSERADGGGGYLQGVQLDKERDAARFAFVDGDKSGGSLKRVYEAVATALQSFGSALVLVDDLSCLLWSGHTSTDVARLFSGLRALVGSVSPASGAVLLPRR